MIEDTTIPMGVLGGGPAKYNLRLAEQALLNDYPMKPEIRQLIVTQAALIVGNAKSKRTKLAAMKVLLAADKHNLNRRALDEGHHRGGTGITLNLQIIEQMVVKESPPPIEVPAITEEVVENDRDHPKDI